MIGSLGFQGFGLTQLRLAHALNTSYVSSEEWNVLLSYNWFKSSRIQVVFRCFTMHLPCLPGMSCHLMPLLGTLWILCLFPQLECMTFLAEVSRRYYTLSMPAYKVYILPDPFCDQLSFPGRLTKCRQVLDLSSPLF